MSIPIYDVENQVVELDGDSRVYVIGPISKYLHDEGNKYNIRNFERVREAIESRFHSHVSIPQDFIPDDIPYEDMMDLSFDHLKHQDAVVRLWDWNDSAGAQRESALALSCGIPLIEEDTVLS